MQALRQESQRRRVSIAAIIRTAVDAELAKDEREARWERAMAVVGKYRSGHPDIGQKHDLYLDPDYEP
jgi:hypothetical protein